MAKPSAKSTLSVICYLSTRGVYKKVLTVLSMVLPVFIMMLIGFFIGKRKSVNTSFASDLTIDVFIPCLFFYSIVTSDMSLYVFGKIMLYSTLSIILFMLLSFLINKFIIRSDDKTFRSYLLSTAFVNSGTYGLPVVFLAYGAPGVAICVVYSTAQNIMVNGLGAAIASSSKDGLGKSFLNSLKLPAVWAIALALILKGFNIPVHEVILNTTEILGEAAVPLLLVILGTQLAGMPVSRKDWKFGLASFSGRFALYPAIAIAIMPLFFMFGGIHAGVLILSSFMPAAALGPIFAKKYDESNHLVAFGTIITYVGSVFVLTAVLRVLVG